MRKASKSWLAKGLFGLLILSFAAWGVGDMIRVGVGQRPAIEVGDTDFSAESVVQEYRKELQRRQALLPSLTEEQARAFGMLDLVIQRMVSRSLLDEEAKTLGLMVDDDALRRAVAQNPAFRNQLGQFDRQVFENVIARAGYSEQSFLALFRGDLLRARMQEMVAGGTPAPKAMVEALYRYREEKRVAELIYFSDDSIPAPAAPDEAALRQYHKDHADQFMAPEYRALTVLLMRPADVAGQITIEDNDLQAAYDSRLPELGQPERRNVDQVLLDGPEQAEKAKEMIAAGADLAKIAAELGNKEVQTLGWLDRNGLLPELVEPFFGAPEGKPQVAQSPLGWHLFRVSGIQPAREPALSEVADTLRQDLINERAVDRLYELVNAVEDNLAGGANLDEAAQKAGLKTVKIPAIDIDGKDAAGKPVDTIPLEPKLLETAFTTQQGSESQPTELEDRRGYMIVRVDEVTAPALRPFETVKDQVVQTWQAEQRADAALKKAAEAAERLRAGEAPAEVAKAMGAASQVSEPFTRAHQDQKLPGALVTELFKGQPGAVASQRAEGGAVAAKLLEIKPADPAADAAAVAALSEQLAQGVEASLTDEYLAALQTKVGVSVNRALIEERLR